MTNRAIICLSCGHEGEIEVPGGHSDASPSLIFRHRGHNPISGHMHYQCPACEIVLLVDPMPVLHDDMISALTEGLLRKKADKRQISKLPHRASLLQKLRQNQRAGYC